MKKNDSIDPELLAKYVRGACTPEEAARVDAWYGGFEDRPDDARLTDPTAQQTLKLHMLTRIRAQIAAGGESQKRTRVVWQVAAALALLMAAGVWRLLPSGQDLPEGAPVSIARTVTNRSPAVLKQQLADGTTVWLQPHSTLEIPAGFSPVKRDVRLSGEAFFDVASDQEHPFSIATENVVTRVLGTSFRISAYHSAPSIEVTVMTGKVSVTDSSASILLLPHQGARYVKAQKRLRQNRPEEVTALTMWEETDMEFDGVPIRTAIARLNARFNANILAENESLLNCTLRADFSHQNLPDILEMLSKSIDASYRIEEGRIVLSGPGC